jgi:hypothetical protein
MSVHFARQSVKAHPEKCETVFGQDARFKPKRQSISRGSGKTGNA